MKRARQGDFSLGAFAVGSSPEKLPAGASLGLGNMIVDDEGSVRRRGGCEYVTDELAAFDDLPLLLWDGVLAGGQRTVLGTEDGLFVVDAAGTAVQQVHASVAVDRPVLPVVIAGLLVIPVLLTGESHIAFYGGSRETADYSTGTVAVTNGSKTVTGTGTTWLGNVDPGMIFTHTDSGERMVVKSVESNTSLTLTDPFRGATDASSNYICERVSVQSTSGWTGANEASMTSPPPVATVANRLVLAVDSKIYFGNGPDPTTGGVRWGEVMPVDNRHEMPAGADVSALRALGDRLFTFTTAGVFIVSGMAQEIVAPDGSPQHRVDRYSEDVVALGGGAGITTWRDSLVVPASDDVYLMDGFARPVPVSTSARAEWRELVAQGYQAGGAAVYRGHYVLPVLTGGADAGGLWLFRLDRMAETRLGLVAPWVQWTPQGGRPVGAVAVRRSSSGDQLLGSGFGSASRARVLDFTPGFDMEETNETDADGSVVVGGIVLRDFAGGRGALWRFVRIRYKLVTGAGAADEISLTHYAGGDAELGSGVALSAEAGNVALAHDVYTWALQRQSEFLRLVLLVSGGTEFVLHEVEAEFLENRSGRA